MVYPDKFIDSLSVQRELILSRLRSQMAQALINDPYVRLSIENIDFMNLAHLIKDKDLVIDLESLINTVLCKDLNSEAHLNIQAAPKTSCPNCKTSHS